MANSVEVGLTLNLFKKSDKFLSLSVNLLLVSSLKFIFGLYQINYYIFQELQLVNLVNFL